MSEIERKSFDELLASGEQYVQLMLATSDMPALSERELNIVVAVLAWVLNSQVGLHRAIKDVLRNHAQIINAHSTAIAALTESKP